MALITVPLVLQLPETTVDTRNESFFREDDTALVEYNAFRDQFGNDEIFIIAASAPDVFERGFLKKLRALHEELKEAVPYLDDITSLVNARDTRGEGDTLIVEDLLKNWPETDRELTVLRKRALSNPIYVNNLISEDATLATIILKTLTYVPDSGADILEGFEEGKQRAGRKRRYLSNEQNIEIADAVTAVLKKHEAPDFALHFAGTPAVVAALDRGMRKTLITLTPLAVFINVVFLFIMFRRVSGVLFPMAIVIASMLSTFGLMAAMRMPMTNVTQILPTFLIVVGVGDSVHILAVFYLRYGQTGDKDGSIAYALGHSGLAVLMTSLTTAAGLLSFAAADVAPIVDLGLVAPMGVMLALIYTVVLLPALLSLFPLKRPGEKAFGKSAFEDRALSRIARISTAHPVKILIISLIIAAVSMAGAMKLRFSHNGLKWLPEDNPVRQSTELMDERLKGTITLEAVIDTGRDNGLYEPHVLDRLEESVRYAEGLREGRAYVGKAWTLTTIVKEINRALNENRDEFYSIPRSRELVAQELLLFENSGSDDLEEFVDTGFRKARFTLKAPFHDAMKYKGLMEKIEAHFRQNYPDAEVKLTGVMALFIAIIHNVITTMTKSYVIALTVITVLMVLLIGRVRIGMLSMVPNLVPLLMVLGIMGFSGIPMDLSNILVGSVAIGLVVDDTIHFMHNFRRYFEQSGDVARSVDLTLRTTGRAMLITSVVLSCGFFSTMLAEMRNTFYYGLLTGCAVILALAADFFLAPALMAIANRKTGREKQNSR
jgi:predicted RND superfamily exporter protein